MLLIAETVPWYLSSTFLPAAFGLLGVIIGGLITATSSHFLDQARIRREEAKEKRNRAIEVTRAARLIDADLALFESAVNTVLSEKRWWPSEPVRFEIKGWHEYRVIIASELSFNDWNILRTAMLVVNNLFECRAIAAAANGADPDYPQMLEEHTEVVSRVKTQLGSARNALASYTGYVAASKLGASG